MGIGEGVAEEEVVSTIIVAATEGEAEGTTTAAEEVRPIEAVEVPRLPSLEGMDRIVVVVRIVTSMMDCHLHAMTTTHVVDGTDLQYVDIATTTVPAILIATNEPSRPLEVLLAVDIPVMLATLGEAIAAPDHDRLLEVVVGGTAPLGALQPIVTRTTDGTRNLLHLEVEIDAHHRHLLGEEAGALRMIIVIDAVLIVVFIVGGTIVGTVTKVYHRTNLQHQEIHPRR